METIRIVLITFGGVLCFAAGLALALSKPEPESPTHDILDGLSGGVVGLLVGLFRGIRAGFKGPSASQFPLLILFILGGTLIASGLCFG